MEGIVNYDIVRKASLIGVIVLLFLYLVSLVLSYRTTQNLFSVFADPNNLPLERPLAVDGSSPTPDFNAPLDGMFGGMILSTLLNCLTYLIPGLLAGGLYSLWHNRQPSPPSGAIKGGMFSGALAAAVGGFLSGLIGLVVMIPLQLQFMSTMSQSFGAELPLTNFPIGTLLVFGLGSLLFSLIFWALAGAVTGVLGGLIGDSIFRPRLSPKLS